MNKGDREYIRVLERGMSYREQNEFRHLVAGEWNQEFIDALTILFKKDIDMDLLED